MRKANVRQLASLVERFTDQGSQSARAFKRAVDGASENLQPNELPSEFNLLKLRRAKQRSKLFDYQEELVTAAFSTYENSSRPHASLLSLPTGAGKTRTAISFVFSVISRTKRDRIHWIAPTNELIDQAIQTCRNMWSESPAIPDIDVDRKGQSEDESSDANHVLRFSTIQSAYSALKSGKDYFAGTDIVIFDEAHQIAAPTFEQVFRSAMEAGAFVLGLSATPGRVERSESAHLATLFDQEMLISEFLKPNAITVLQRRGVLSRIHFRNLDDHGKYSSRFEISLKIMREAVDQDSSILVFTESVAQAHAFNVVLNSSGMKVSSVLSSNTAKDERSDVIDSFSSGKLPVLLNQQILTTGFDSPGVRHLLLTNRIGSPVLFEQMVGRVARGPVVGGVANSYVWQFDDHLGIHGYPTSYHRYEDYEWGERTRDPD